MRPTDSIYNITPYDYASCHLCMMGPHAKMDRGPSMIPRGSIGCPEVRYPDRRKRDWRDHRRLGCACWARFARLNQSVDTGGHGGRRLQTSDLHQYVVRHHGSCVFNKLCECHSATTAERQRHLTISDGRRACERRPPIGSLDFGPPSTPTQNFASKSKSKAKTMPA